MASVIGKLMKLTKDKSLIAYINSLSIPYFLQFIIAILKDKVSSYACVSNKSNSCPVQKEYLVHGLQNFFKEMRFITNILFFLFSSVFSFFLLIIANIFFFFLFLLFLLFMVVIKICFLFFRFVFSALGSTSVL